MQLNDMVLVSVDDHVCEPPDLFERHVPEKWRARAPRLLQKQNGADVWYFDGHQIPNVGLNAVAGRPPEEYGMEPTALSQLRRGCYDVRARVDDMNAAGILGSMCFATMTGFCGELWGRLEDKTLARVLTESYNDWHVDDWCASAPGRFIPLALPMLWDPRATAEEIRRLAKRGCHAMTFPDVPPGLGYPSLHSDYWTPIWEAADECGTVLCMHIGSGTGMNLQDTSAPIEIMITGTPITLYNGVNELVFSKFLPKYRNLKFALSEGGIGWIPYFLERADYVHRHHHRWTLNDLGGKLPSDIFREHIVSCFIDDAVGVRNRDLIGLDSITWECDYPHSDSTWPHAPEALWQSLAALPDGEIDAITHRNAMKHFSYDPFAHVPRASANVAALRAQAQHVDLAPKRGLGGKTPSDYGAGYATIGDVIKQMSGAFAVAFREGQGVDEALVRKQLLERAARAQAGKR
ncbi:MAG: amidohydrolase family protein [Myxococcota bacterium]